MPEFNDLGFALVNIKTVQYAIIEEAFRKTGEVKISTDAGYGVSTENRQIVVNLKFRFFKKETPFISLEVECYFEINKKGWKLLEQEDGSIVLPKSLVSHLTVLTVGTTRGILHAKTEGTRYNEYILPTINVNEMMEGDVIFDKEELN